MFQRAILVLFPLLLAACPQSDVGRPCNHGPGFVPQDQTITFPALTCDQLLCVYAEDAEAPAEQCDQDADCNADPSERKFRCEESSCILGQTYVMNRSMCSQSCESDSDCQGSDPDSSCSRGFVCARIQGLGDHCCEKLCVCQDDLDVATAERLETECSADAAAGCCDQTPHPESCG